jgi:hypothetical protein
MPVVNVTQHYGDPVAMTVTNLQSLAADNATPFAGWQSVLVDLKTAVKPIDVEIYISLTTANTAPADDKCVYIYICPFFYDGAAWRPSSQGTTTLPTGVEGTTSIVVPNALRLLDTIPYSTQLMVMQRVMMLGDLFRSMPDGFSIIIHNNSGAAFATGCVVAYRPITQDIT